MMRHSFWTQKPLIHYDDKYISSTCTAVFMWVVEVHCIKYDEGLFIITLPVDNEKRLIVCTVLGITDNVTLCLH